MEIYNSQIISIKDIPHLPYDAFFEQVVSLMQKDTCHCCSYFACAGEQNYTLIAVLADDDAEVLHVYKSDVSENTRLKSLTALFPAFQLFESEISEQTSLRFKDHPWPKPVRNPLGDYPFYSIEGDDLHEVGVGPIHAGIIEPGHFRFICNGEKVLHLEIVLGYQHRGIENQLLRDSHPIKRQVLVESIAGDSPIAHSLAYAQLMESLSHTQPTDRLMVERMIALELERVAMHLADTGALCGDVAYQLGKVVCEALRTMTINSMQYWCGNRFGKGLIRPGGTPYPLTGPVADHLLNQLNAVFVQYSLLTDKIFSLPSVLSRFENIGVVQRQQALAAGLVGPAARASGLLRDIRVSHSSQAYAQHYHSPLILTQGDVWARAMLRRLEVLQSIDVIRLLIDRWKNNLSDKEIGSDTLELKLEGDAFAVSLIEGWRGEIVHVGWTDATGNMKKYKIKDPSFHNWTGLALAMRGQQISDFPICNKSFNLSYAGFDL